MSHLVDEGGELFNAATFIVFGTVILGPVLGTGARRLTVAFLGWFGPRGVASIVFAIILIDDTELPQLHTLLLAITVTIALSVYAHGLTARPLTERYTRWWNSHPRDGQRQSAGRAGRPTAGHTSPLSRMAPVPARDPPNGRSGRAARC